MIELLTAGPNWVFAGALGLMAFVGVIEVLGVLAGGGLSDWLDSLLPELDVDGDISAPELSGGFGAQVLDFLCLGRVPVLVLLVIFLAGFGLAGLVVQTIALELVGFVLTGWLVVPIALVVGLGTTNVLGRGLARVMPKQETDAVSDSTFVGRIAVITLGTARPQAPAEAKLRDEHGHTHYIMVEPDRPEAQFEQGTEVLLVAQRGAVFTAIVNPSPVLTD
ncbi:MAG: YqiJ family protein [Pseudomonadota bacterium]